MNSVLQKILVLLVLGLVPVHHAIAQTASEIPLTDPEVLAPADRQQDGIQGHTLPDIRTRMTLKKLTEIVRTLDPQAIVQNRQMQLLIADTKVNVIADPDNNRMRAFVPIKTLDGVDGQALYRMMQANFDSALDARYAIAQGHVISVFIHPLEELAPRQFIEGLGQVVNLVLTYGTAYTSGAMTFGGGDSRNLHRELIDELLKKGEEI